MVERHEFLLDIGARAHLLGGADQHPDLPGAHLAEQLLFLCLRVGAVDIGYFFGWYAPGNQLIPQVIIDILKFRHLVAALLVWDHFNGPVLARGGEVAEYHLRGTLVRCALPYIKHIPNTSVDFAGVAVREQGVKEPLVQGQLAPVVGDKQHIVLGTVHHPVADLLRPLPQRRHHLLLLFRGF